MATAMRIVTLNGALEPQATFNFENYEVAEGDILPEIDYTVQRAQNGQPTVILKTAVDSVYRNGEIRLRVHGATTLAKLYSIRNHLLQGLLVRLYPIYEDDDSDYLIGFLDMRAFREQNVFSGYDAGNDFIRLNFYESSLQEDPD